MAVKIGMQGVLTYLFCLLPSVERMQSFVQQPWKFIGTKENVYIRKEFNSTRLVWYTNMAAVSLLWYTNMATMASCAYALFVKTRIINECLNNWEQK